MEHAARRCTLLICYSDCGCPRSPSRHCSISRSQLEACRHPPCGQASSFNLAGSAGMPFTPRQDIRTELPLATRSRGCPGRVSCPIQIAACAAISGSMRNKVRADMEFGPLAAVDSRKLGGHWRGLPTPGEVAEWLKAADCKSARASVRWFESSPLHHSPMRIFQASPNCARSAQLEFQSKFEGFPGFG